MSTLRPSSSRCSAFLMGKVAAASTITSRTSRQGSSNFAFNRRMISAAYLQGEQSTRIASTGTGTSSSRCHVSTSCFAYTKNIQRASLHLPRHLPIANGRCIPQPRSAIHVLSAAKRKSSNTATSSSNKPYKLVIVESPSKAKTIASILNDYARRHDLPHTYTVDSCLGHVRDLPRSAGQTKRKFAKVLGVDVDNRYEPHYIIPERQKKTVDRLKELADEEEGCVGIVLATDEDREGEAIAWHLHEVLGEAEVGTETDMGEGPSQIMDMTRVTFNEISPSAIETAFFGKTDDGAKDLDTNIDNPVIEAGHDIDMDLVSAQETRRVLDRLAGYTVSPLLWKKVAPGLSAGRVQSVGLKLVVDRERERMKFVSAEWWDARATLCATSCFNATLVSVDGRRVASGKDFDGRTGQLVLDGDNSLVHLQEESARKIFDNIGSDATWTVTSIESKSRSNTSPPPFITSTLQQESNRRLGLSVSDTMRAAQMLYEGGYISYMRTDSTHLSGGALEAGKKAVADSFGSEFISDIDPNVKSAKRKKKKKDKNAQEAHEAIRPSINEGRFLRPEEILAHSKQKSGGVVIADRALQLYDLIYRRTCASFMSDQVLNQTSVGIQLEDDATGTSAQFRASGSVVVFGGYSVAWGGAASTDASQSILPPLTEGEKLACAGIDPVGHTTKPPARYNEASFVKELEALGVGRPSTYASVVQTLRQRAYIGTPLKADETARAKSTQATGTTLVAQRVAGGDEFMGSGRGALCPSLSAFVVCSLLEKHFPSYVDPTFTASMEDKLDSIASGAKDVSYFSYLDEYYGGDDGLAAQVERIDKSLDSNEARKANLPSLTKNEGENATDTIGLFIGPWGAYIQKTGQTSDSDDKKPTTANLPQGLAADLSLITPEVLNALLSAREKDGILMGAHPDDGRNVRIRIGRYGAYLQWGDDGEEGTSTHSLPKDVGGLGGRNINLSGGEDDTSMSTTLGISFEEAVGYTKLPRTVCELDDLPILASIGPYGPYLKYNNTFVSLPKAEGDVLTVDEATAKRIVIDGIINKPAGLGRGVLAELGEREGSMVRVKDGKFGMYVNWKKVNAKMPAEYQENPSELPLDDAWALIQAKAGSAAQKGKSSKGKAAKSKDIDLPAAPKRPLSAYLIFCQENRPEVAMSATTLGEVSKALAAMWADTGSEDRSKYEEIAAVGKKEYEERKREWQNECDKIMAENGLSKASKLNGRRQKNAVKRPLSAYLFFCKEKRPEIAKEGMSLGDVSKELARLWAETATGDGEGRAPYQELAAADKVRYEEEMKASTGKKSTATTKQRKTKTKSNKRPRAKSAYMLFCSANRQSLQTADGNKPSFGETTKMLAEMWQNIDETTRAEFYKQAEDEKAKLLESLA